METLTKQERREMSAVAATDMLRTYAAEAWPRINHKGRLRELSKLLPWGPRRVRAIYNGESGVSLKADESEAIHALTGEAKRAVEQSQANYRTLEARIAQLEALYERIDPEHVGEQVAAFRAQARGQGQGIA